MEIAEYLRLHDGIMNGRCLEAIAYRFGQEYEPLGHLPKGVACGRQGYCFMNAYYRAAELGLQYVEGFAVRGVFPLPVHHAWVLMDGKAVDVTWKEQGTAYYGIALDMEYIHKVFVETKVYGVLNPKSMTFLERFVPKVFERLSRT